MKRATILGLGVFLVMISLNAGAWAYSIELTYGPSPAANNSTASVDDSLTYIPPETESGNGSVAKQLSLPPVAAGSGEVSAVLGSSLATYQKIIAVAATSGQTNDPYTYGYGYGYGDTTFAFMIKPAAGESPNVWATIGYKVTGKVTINNSGDYYQTYLTYQGTFKDIENNIDHNILLVDYPTPKKWNVTTGPFEESYFDSNAINLLLETNKNYIFYGFLEADSFTDGTFSGENIATFESSLFINNIQSAPLPATVWLLAGSLILLGGVARRR